MNKIKYFALIAAVLGSATTFAADESAFQFQNSVRVGYDDNVYAVKNNVTETAFITDIINISGNLNFSDRSEMELFWQPEFRYRFDADPELVSYQDLYARFSHGLSERTFLEISDRFRYQVKDGQSDLGSTNLTGEVVDQNFLENDLLGALTFTLNAVSQIRVGAGYEFRTWDDDSYGEGTGVYTGRGSNYDQVKANGAYIRELRPETTHVRGGVDFSTLTYDGTRGGFDSTVIYGGVDHYFNPKMVGTAQLGYQFSAIDSTDGIGGPPTSTDASSPFLELSLNHNSSDRTTLTGGLGYSLQKSENSLYNATEAFSLNLGLRHELTGKISLSSTLRYVFSMYDSSYSSLGLPDNEENFFQFALRGSYQLNRNNFLDAGYAFTMRDPATESLGLQDYTRNRLDFGWRLRF